MACCPGRWRRMRRGLGPGAPTRYDSTVPALRTRSSERPASRQAGRRVRWPGRVLRRVEGRLHVERRDAAVSVGWLAGWPQRPRWDLAMGGRRRVGCRCSGARALTRSAILAWPGLAWLGLVWPLEQEAAMDDGCSRGRGSWRQALSLGMQLGPLPAEHAAECSVGLCTAAPRGQCAYIHMTALLKK